MTPEGFPLAYEVLAGNTSDKTTLGDFLAKIEKQYGKADRIWVMDRGIPTEETLAKMRASSPPVSYLVGTPKGRLTALEKDFLGKPWSQAREAVSVKLLEREGEVYILAKSQGRVLKERAMRRKKLKTFWARLKELLRQAPSRDQLLLKIGAAQKEAGRAASLVTVKLPKAGQPVTPETFAFMLNRERLRACRRHEGRYLLRSNLVGQAPAELWAFYIQLTEVEQAFKELKGDLAIRPVYHQTDERIEAHIFVAFLAYGLQVTLKQRLRALAPGLTPTPCLRSSPPSRCWTFTSLPRTTVRSSSPAIPSLRRITSSSCSSSSSACRHSRRPGSLSRTPPIQPLVVPTSKGWILLYQSVRSSQ